MSKSIGTTENVNGKSDWRTDVIRAILKELPMSADVTMFETADLLAFNWYPSGHSESTPTCSWIISKSAELPEDRYLGNGCYVWRSGELLE